MNEQKQKIISDICPLYKEYGTCEQCNKDLDIDDEPCYFEHMANAIINNKYVKQSENIVELPCALGTTLYFLYDNKWADNPDLTPRIYESNEWYFDIRNRGVYIKPIDIHGYKGTYRYELGVNVFFTMEEAKMKGGVE